MHCSVFFSAKLDLSDAKAAVLINEEQNAKMAILQQQVLGFDMERKQMTEELQTLATCCERLQKQVEELGGKAASKGKEEETKEDILAHK